MAWCCCYCWLLLTLAYGTLHAEEVGAGAGAGGGGGVGGGGGGGGGGSLPPRPPGAWNVTWTDRLKRDLLLNYDKFARPAQHTNTTVVRMGMTVRHVEMDELRSIMTVHGWVRMTWVDEKLQWNETDYGGLNVLHVADHEIWQPDIVLYNSATGSIIDHYGNTHCLAYPNGEVLWVPPSQFQVFCDLDLRLWPFDTQSCHLTLGSWTYDGDQVDILLDKQGTAVELMETNSEWELVGVQEARNVRTYTCCPEPYIDITYELTLRRRSPTYSAIVITPATVIVLMTLATFWLPPTAGEKIMLSGVTAIIICIFLIFFSQRLPAMASHTPLVVLFYSSSLYLVCVSALMSVVVLNLSRNQHSSQLPWALRSLLTGWLGHGLGLGHLIAQQQSSCSPHHHMGAMEELRETHEDNDHTTADDRQMISTPTRSRASTHLDWILLAAAIDRITFLVYCLLFAILAIVYAV